MNKTLFLRPVGALSLLFMAATGASAHTFWVNLNTHQAGQGQPVAYIGWGHLFPASETIERDKLGHYRVIAGDAVTDLEPTPGGFLVAPIPDAVKGPAVVAASYAPHIFTMWEENGKMQYETRPKTGLANVKSSSHYEMYGKALLQGENPAEADFTQPVGDAFEIVPAVNPATLEITDGATLPRLKLTLLLQGKPAAAAEVNATYLGYSTGGGFAQKATADAKGEVSLLLTTPGIWMVAAQATLPIRDEWKDNADDEQYHATLTFEVSRKGATQPQMHH